jgi:hypothetical protein
MKFFRWTPIIKVYTRKKNPAYARTYVSFAWFNKSFVI